METLLHFKSKSDAVDIYFKQKVAIIKLKANIFDEITDITKNQKFFHFFDIVKRDKRLKAILILNEHGSLGKDEFDSFMGKILDKETLAHHTELPEYCDKNLRFKEINFFNRLIKHILKFHKMFFTCLAGEIVTPFFGTSLTADYRFATENMKFSLPHLQYGLHPSGGLAYLLTKYLHHSKASEILLTGKEIPAKEALELGLVNEIIPNDDFETACVKRVLEMVNIPNCSIRSTKRLLNHCRKDLFDYLDFESTILNL